MIPAHFAQTGFHVKRRSGSPNTAFQVLGERSSGTNFVKRLLGRNTEMKPTEALGWKHGFPSTLAIPANLAVICVVRSADAWATSMYNKPWHTTQEMQQLRFDRFLRARWDTLVDHPRYFDGAQRLDQVGQPLQQDRHPLTGLPFPNLFALRRAKLVGLLSYLERDCTCVLLRMEEAQANPEAMLDQLRRALLQGPRTAPFAPVLKRLGSKFRPAGDTPREPGPAKIGPKGMAFLRKQLDLELEARLGYDYSTADAPLPR